ncbi:arylacetamide deacetylase-like [Symsagittifera roscoffensis]|uniref:arylacetamide deacetylase-like n=1 Tax=Symsagittifera roscoffensis TaxID=84072 RepID=UPI00307CC336
MNLKLAVVSISVALAAILVYLISANKWTDDQLEFPLCYTHGILPLRRLLPKLIPKKSLENGTYLRHSAQQMRQMRSWCLKNEPDAPLESVYKDGRREILRYAGERVTSPKTTLVHIHGGGYVFGSPEEAAGSVLRMQNETGGQMFFIRYSLAPEHLFPTAVDDCVAMVKYIMDHSEQLGVDRRNVQIFGDSAGGNLVTQVALQMLEQKDKYPIKAVHAVYPVYYMLYDFPAMKEFSTDPAGILNLEDIARLFNLFLLGNGDCTETKLRSQHVSKRVWSEFKGRVETLAIWNTYPLSKMNIEKIDPTTNAKNHDADCQTKLENQMLDSKNNIIFAAANELKRLNDTRFNVYSCEIDLLRDDSFFMAAILGSLGVDYHHSHIENCYHGAFNDNTKGGISLMDDVIRQMKKYDLNLTIKRNKKTGN